MMLAYHENNKPFVPVKMCAFSWKNKFKIHIYIGREKVSNGNPDENKQLKDRQKPALKASGGGRLVSQAFNYFNNVHKF